MKLITKRNYTIFFICLLMLFNYLDVSAQTQSNKIIVDDFEKPGKKNSLGFDFGAFADGESLGYCYIFFVEDKSKDLAEKKGYSLYIQFDTTKKGAYGGYWTDLRHLNLEDFNYLSFYLKGVKGGEKFKVGLRGKMDASYETKILINEILGKDVTTEWEKVKIPLKRFEAISDWRDVNMFSINFENAFGSGKGAIMIDDIAFEK